MTEDELDQLDNKLYEYLVEHDFTTEEWATPNAAKHFGVKESDIYKSLSKLAKLKKEKVWIYYQDGRIKIAAE